MLATRHIPLAAILLSTLVGSCAHSTQIERPNVVDNPQARMLYEITVTVNRAPGGFDSIQGHVDYRVTNPDCTPMTTVMGATVVPEEQTPIEFKPVGESVFKGHVLLDAIKDEDYFGRGVCHWSVVGVVAGLRHNNVSFSPAIVKDDILSGRKVVKHFSNRSYERSGDERIDIGANDTGAYNHPEATFSISLHAVAQKP